MSSWGAGTYYVRVRSKNAGGISAASNDVVVVNDVPLDLLDDKSHHVV